MIEDFKNDFINELGEEQFKRIELIINFLEKEPFSNSQKR